MTHIKAKHMPHDLRQKKTRAYRRKLSVADSKKMTPRAMKRTSNFKLRKFALAA